MRYLDSNIRVSLDGVRVGGLSAAIGCKEPFDKNIIGEVQQVIYRKTVNKYGYLETEGTTKFKVVFHCTDTEGPLPPQFKDRPFLIDPCHLGYVEESDILQPKLQKFISSNLSRQKLLIN